MSKQEFIPAEWTSTEKILFRFAFIFFIVLVVPFNAGFYKLLFSTNWLQSEYGDLFALVRYTPDFTGNPSHWLNVLIVVIIAAAGAALWTFTDKNTKEYARLYYWLRVLVRYRLAAALLVFAFIKYYPLQSPEPSVSNLNTAYGDFSAWKIFSLTLGVVPGYQSFLGLTELLAALLLLNRRTATLATLVIIPFTGNVFFSNLAYEGGEGYYSFYLLLLAGFLLLFDVKRLYSLIAQEQPTFPNRFNPVFSDTWKKNSRYALKGLFIGVFVIWYGAKAHAAYSNDPYQYPKFPGLESSAGLYNVREFRLNHQELPYSAVDPVRWQDVVFEKWNTISIRSNRPVIIDSANTEHIHSEDKYRNYELLGSAGRHYYSYETNPEKGELTLSNRNHHYAGETLALSYTRPDSSTFILQGLNENRDSIYVVLEKIEKKYLFEEVRKTGRRGALKL